LAHGTGEIRDYARGVRGSHQLAQASVDLVSRMHNTPSNPEVLTTRKRVTVREKAEETSLPERLVGAARNRWIAGKLEDFASLLEQQGDGPFRPRAYRKAAATVASLPEPIDTILARQGRDGLISLPTIGAGIAAAIAEMAASGRWQQLDRLRGELTPEALVRTLPGIGPQLARRLCSILGVSMWQGLAHDDARCSQRRWPNDWGGPCERRHRSVPTCRRSAFSCRSIECTGIAQQRAS
jgi:hypothetical protein